MLEDLDRLMDEEGVDSLLAVGNSFHTPDIYWLTGFRSSDIIIFFQNRGEEPLVATGFNTLERVKKESFITRTHDMTGLYLDLMRDGKRATNHPDIVYAALLKELFTGDTLGVPDHIPAKVLVAIQQLGYNVKVVPHLLKQARATKSKREVDIIAKAGVTTIGAMSRIVEMIKDSEIGPKKTLMYKGKPLTVCDVKLALDHFLLDQNAESAEDAIVAVGTKGHDWHYLGQPADELKADVPIIMDVFPRLKVDRYVADVTRTVVKGNVSKEVKAMFDAVHAASESVVDVLADGVKIDAEVNKACYETLKKHGHDSIRLNADAKEGMTHGLGHGIGLDVHEYPSLYDRAASLLEGHVLAIEPGVYYEKIGGVRIENDYVVTRGRPKRLTTGLDDILFL